VQKSLAGLAVQMQPVSSPQQPQGVPSESGVASQVDVTMSEAPTGLVEHKQLVLPSETQV
jgi:hypothetical protein